MSSQSHHVSATPDRSNDRDSDRNSLSPTARKRALTQNRVSKKRERDSAITEVAITSVPAKCLPYDTTPNTVAQTIHKDFQSLQQKDCTARPDHWWEVLNTLPQKQRKSFVQHSWTMIQQSHYHLTLTSSDLRAQLDSGLKLPLFIPPQSQLGQEVSNQSPWFKQSLEMLLDKALRHTDASISVQDHSLPTLGMFTVPKKCQDVRSRFRLNVEDRGEAWNCLEIRDCLPGDKGPQPLANGARLLDWQFSDPSNTAMSRLDFVALPGSKQVHKWFLVSEKKSGSTAHVDTGYATWVSCLAGRKTFWIRNPDIVDHRQWKDLDVNDDHELFEEPWGRIDLLPGSILVFPPGTVHAVFSPEDSVFAGGHFLTPQIMDRFLSVLSQTEMDPSRTNDLQSVDFFRILENFVEEVFAFSADLLSRKHLQRFILVLEEYVGLKPPSQPKHSLEDEHLKRRKIFVNSVHKKGWIQGLREVVDKMGH